MHARALCADATEVLQEDVMEFVNSIAQIVHSEVRLRGGDLLQAGGSTTSTRAAAPLRLLAVLLKHALCALHACRAVQR